MSLLCYGLNKRTAPSFGGEGYKIDKVEIYAIDTGGTMRYYITLTDSTATGVCFTMSTTAPGNNPYTAVTNVTGFKVINGVIHVHVTDTTKQFAFRVSTSTNYTSTLLTMAISHNTSW